MVEEGECWVRGGREMSERSSARLRLMTSFYFHVTREREKNKCSEVDIF